MRGEASDKNNAVDGDLSTMGPYGNYRLPLRLREECLTIRMRSSVGEMASYQQRDGDRIRAAARHFHMQIPSRTNPKNKRKS